jgi:gamma-glutamyltranspeptidase/glutathione hydrolase
MRIPVIATLILALSAVPFGRSAQTTATDLGVPAPAGVVVSATDIASDIGASILSKGGNGVDAAVATAFALAVTYPFAGNIGGGGFMVVRTPDGKATTFDYREKAPLKSTPTMYLNSAGEIDRGLTAAGYLAPGVPGTVRGMALAHQRFGKLPWREIVRPAVEIAADGFVMPGSLARGLNNEVRGAMARFPASVAAYGKPGGGQWQDGDRLLQPDLARSLNAIAENPDAFYTGWIADFIANDMANNGGLIGRDDLSAYKAAERAPVRGTFLGYEIISMPPPSSGGTALIESLNMLEALGIEKTTRGSAESLHMVAEVMRRAFLDRARYLGDPDFVQVPVAKLIGKAHAQDIIKTFSPAKASSSAELGKDIISVTLPAESNETTHFSVVDKDGMAVSNTYTLEGGYGSHVVIRGTGILLNNEMGDFNKKPGTTNLTGDIGTAPNLIAPGKRMLSSMTPVIVVRNGKVVLVTGSPGGRTIINTSLNVVLNVTAWNMTGRQAVEAPRSDHEWMPDRLNLEADAVSEDVLAKLRALGHTVRQSGRQGSANSIWIQPATGMVYGVNDKREATSKASAAR